MMKAVKLPFVRLSGINLGEINQLEDIKEPELIVRPKGCLFDYQDYPSSLPKNGRRNAARWVLCHQLRPLSCQNGTKYSDPTALGLTFHRTLKPYNIICWWRPINWLKSKGLVLAFGDTTYSQGIFTD